MEHLKKIAKFIFKFAVTSYCCSLISSDGTGDTNINLPSYGTNATMPRSDNAFDNAVNDRSSEFSQPIGQGIGDDLDVSIQLHTTLLHQAAAKNDVKTILWLLQNEADIDAIDDLHRTALHEAVQNNCYDAAAQLVAMGADTKVQDVHQKTALDYAHDNRMKKILEKKD